MQALQRTLFGSGIGKSARIVHFATVDEARRRTLETLLDLAGESSPNACWDDASAVTLLRSQATREELEELGANEHLLAHIYPETHG